ncbi:hypothetical protein [Erythrobacter litoralis]|uniref:Uncharacterized protein n=1 Tax=Erythrobacter litoralis (strain HTCC2594) TaxID=314225 RepID=Q2NC28_ERYLH|nr:hypothetical protein [Erythrobacter litoralis]ABC62763.1 hypothetical protein ELI_03355 [Erythrobacter litoralis HTCC2594]
MDSDLILIFGFILTVVVIITLGINGIIAQQMRQKRWLEEHREKKRTRVSDEAYKALEDRIRVLERIATEKDDPLAMQIEQLRDLQDIDTQIDSKERTQ